MKRREFLAFTATATAVFQVPLVIKSWGESGFKEGRDIQHVIVDARFDESRLFARAMSRVGYSVSAFHGDITELWSEFLDIQWRRSPEVMAGQTTLECFSCLNQLAAGNGLYPKFWIEHEPVDNWTARHQINGPASCVSMAGRDMAESKNWIQTAVSLLDSINLQQDLEETDRLNIKSKAVTAGHREETLVSWIMIPTYKTRRLNYS